MADFKLGRIKFKWRGDWATSTAYVVDDIVKYGGNSYVVVTNHTSQSSSANFYTDIAKYSLHTEGLFFKGDWAASTHYKLNDLVKYGAFQYRTTTQHTSHASTFDPSKFEVYGEGFQFEDTYNASTTYQDGDVVTYGGYTYVWINNTPGSGQTPTDNTYWDVVTTGFKALGTYSHGTTYKTGDTIQYGGNNYVCTANHTNQYPANTNGTTNTSYWTLNIEGFNYRAAYNAGTTYNIGDVVRYTTSSYVLIKDRIVNVQPDTDGTAWQIVAQGDSAAVMSSRGDLTKQGSSAAERLPIGVKGSVLTTDGVDPIWGNAEAGNVKYVANSGSDSNPGTEYLPYKSLYYALSQASSGDIVEIDTISGGTGGTPGTFNDIAQTSSTGSGTGAKFRITTDGSSTPTIVIIDGGSGHTVGDDITINGSGIGSSSNLTFNIKSASVGDVIYVKNGVYRETLPIRIPPGVTVQGESLRGTEIRPNTGTGHQVKTVSINATVSGATQGSYNYKTSATTSGSGAGFVINITIDSSGNHSGTTIYHGGYGFVGSETITFTTAQLGCGGSGTIVYTVTALENNDASNMFLMNNSTNLVQMSMKGLTGTPGAGGTGKAAVTSLDPTGSITVASPYVQNCSSVNSGATGVQIDGLLHSAGNKSILANDFTQINSDGIGVHTIGGGRGEMVSIFTYYCDKSFYAQSGGFIRGLNCSSGYGEKGAVSDGTLASETPVSTTTRGEMLKYNATTFGGGATETDFVNAIANQGRGAAIITGAGGATATLFRHNISLDFLHIENRSGNFVKGETITVRKEDSSTFTVNLDSSFGGASHAQKGQEGPLIAVKGAALGSANAIKLGTNIVFTGNSTYFRASLVSEESTAYDPPGAGGVTGIATIRLTASVASGDALAADTATTITEDYSNIRLTGHDFLDIGTGDIATSNYPGGPSQAADQSDEVDELNGGRVYFTSTDQKGDFRVGDLFRIEQSTGVATLNADAFDLSGLSQLQLGSIGAELGATINEFSTDQTLIGNSNTAVPTENAVYGHLHGGHAGTDAFRLPAGTTAQRPSPVAGMIRYNSDIALHEQYVSGAWEKIDTKTTGKSIALAMIFG